MNFFKTWTTKTGGSAIKADGPMVGVRDPATRSSALVIGSAIQPPNEGKNHRVFLWNTFSF